MSFFAKNDQFFNTEGANRSGHKQPSHLTPLQSHPPTLKPCPTQNTFYYEQ
jgi:hypothetical protein